jgi:antitoxin (DNA-binding transcriptional repressor) of toxin-antitoxin stability system
MPAPFLVGIDPDACTLKTKSNWSHRAPQPHTMSVDALHGHHELSVPTGEFKRCCLARLDQVAEIGMSIVVTKRGLSIARVVPIEPSMDVFSGSLRVLTEEEEKPFSTLSR